MAFQDFFPCTPQYLSWEDFNGNLLVYYSQEPIPFNTEDNWQNTARGLMLLPTFMVYPVPDPEKFQTWQDWASEFTLIVNGRSG